MNNGYLVIIVQIDKLNINSFIAEKYQDIVDVVKEKVKMLVDRGLWVYDNINSIGMYINHIYGNKGLKNG